MFLNNLIFHTRQFLKLIFQAKELETEKISQSDEGNCENKYKTKHSCYFREIISDFSGLQREEKNRKTKLKEK